MNRPHPTRLASTIAPLALLAIPFGCGSEAPMAQPPAVADSQTISDVPGPLPMIPDSAIPQKLEIVAPPDQAVRRAEGDIKADEAQALDDAKSLEKKAEGDAEQAAGRIKGGIKKAKGDARKAVEDAEAEAKRRVEAVEGDARKSTEDALDKMLGDPK